MSGTLVLTASPLSQAYRAELEAALGEPLEEHDLPTLRRLSAPRLLGVLRATAADRCVLAFEDAQAAALQPILHLLALVARPRSIAVAEPGRPLRPLPWRTLPRSLARLLGATLSGFGALATLRREERRLLAEPRHHAAPTPAGRVAYVNANLWFGLKAGGSVGHVAGVVNGLLRHGLGVDLFSAGEPIMIDPDARYTPLPPPSVVGIPYELNLPRFQLDVVRRVLAPGSRYDFVYQRLSTSSFAGVQIARRLGVPLVLEYNGSEVWVARNWGSPLRYERYALDAEDVSFRHADLVVTVSSVLCDELVARGVDRERIVWYPNCIDERIYDPARFSATDVSTLRRAYDIAADDAVVAFIGTFGRWHGVDVLARAIARLTTDDAGWLERHRVRFLLVGDGQRMSEVRTILDRAGAHDRVILPGLVPQTQGPIHLAISDVLVSPHVPNEDGTPFFGSPTKLYEYMAMGKGIVASELDQIGDTLTPGLHARALPTTAPASGERALAVLAAPGDVDELVTGIRFLVEQREWRTALGANARAEALAKYTWSHHVAAILDGLRKATG